MGESKHECELMMYVENVKKSLWSNKARVQFNFIKKNATKLRFLLLFFIIKSSSHFIESDVKIGRVFMWFSVDINLYNLMKIEIRFSFTGHQNLIKKFMMKINLNKHARHDLWRYFTKSLSWTFSRVDHHLNLIITPWLINFWSHSWWVKFENFF